MERSRKIDTRSLGAVLIVAPQNLVNGVIFDWAAYIGPSAWGEDEIARRGTKLRASQAITFFNLPLEKYRG